MAQQIVNTGTAELAGDGESIRSAFHKINANFTEIYTSGGAGGVGPQGPQGPTGPSNFTNIASHILPAANLTYDLGSTTTQWRSLYVGTSTIYIGGKALSVTPAGDITVDGTPVGGGVAANTGDITFTATTITAPVNSPIRIVSTDTIYNRALVDLDPVYGNVSLQAWSSENTRSDTNAWTTGTWEINIYGNPYMRFTEAYDLAYWITNTLQNSDPDTVSYSINEGSYISWDGGSSADPSTGFVEIYTSGVNPPGNTTTNITSLAWKYRFNSRFEVGYNNGVNLDSGDQYIGINAGSYIQMYAKGSIDIDNSSQPGSDIEINAGDDIWIRGKDRTTSDSEGGDINIEAGDGGPADAGDGGGGGGDIRIIAGSGGNASSAYMGGVGGTIQIYSGDGGSANAANARSSNNGGYLELQAGSAGFNDGDPAFGNAGGNLEIRAGNSNNYTDNGGNVIIQPGTNTAGTSTVAGYVQIQVPASSGAAGGSWYFEGDGQTLRFPNGATIGPEGMGWIGFSNGVSELPLSIVNKNAAGMYFADITLGANGSSGEIYFSVGNTETSTVKTLTLDGFGNLSVPAVIYNNDPSNVGQLLLAGDAGEADTYLALPSNVGSTASYNVRLANSNGDIQLIAGNNKNWYFKNTGGIELPGGSVLATSGYDVALVAGNDGSSTFGSVTINTQAPPAVYTVVQQWSPFNLDTISTDASETPYIASIVPGMTVTGAGITATTTVTNVTGPDEYGAFFISVSPASETGLNYNETYTFTTPGGVTDRNWEFNSLGELNLPQGGAIQETQVTNELWGTTTTSLTLVPGGAANGTQRLEIYATGGGEGDHIHITSGDQTQTDLFLGNDTQYFAVAANGQNYIQARNGYASPSPGISAGPGANVNIYAGNAGDNGGNAVDGNSGGDVYIASGISTSGLGGDILLNTSSGPDGFGSIELSTDGGSSYWTFNKDNQLVFPDSSVQTTAFTGTSALLDITNTNGLTTPYYLTFVENRTTGQEVRADVDLVYDCADNLLRTGAFSATNYITVGGILNTNRGVHEKFTTATTASSVVSYDCATTQLFYHATTGTVANWTANFTNLSLEAGRATTVNIIINQGNTGYYPSAVQIGGAAQTLNWQGNTTPSVSANRKDVVTFSILNHGGSYLVLGQVTGF